MSSPTVLDLFHDSPARDSVEAPVLKILEEVLEILHGMPRGASIDDLRRRIRRNKTFLQDKGMKGFGRILESFGFFRRHAKHGYQLTPVTELDRWIDETPIAVIDLEATGGRPPIHRFIELALVRRAPNGKRKTFSALAYPNRPLPRYVTKVTGIRKGDIEDAPSPVEVFRQSRPFLEDAILVFHGSGPDMEYLNYEAFRATKSLLSQPIVCTTALTRYFEPDLNTMGLDKVLAHMGREVTVQHRALDDAEMTLDLYEIFEERFRDAGLEKIVDLAFFQGVLNDPPYLTTNLSTERLNDLPQQKGAYALWDERERLVHADFTDDLRRQLCGWFFADGSLPPKVRKWIRRTSYLDVLEWDGKSKPGVMVRRLTHPD